MKKYIFCITALLGLASHTAPAAATTFPNDPSTPFSKYGQIQNVQNYSSNPFWTPNSPYNQRMPQPIYAQGADLNTADCQSVVAALIQSYCNTRNYCIDDKVDDIRPTLTVQLAALPNHNYVGSCVGYIDTEFQSYRDAHAAAVPAGRVAFPGATTPNPSATGSEFKIANPLAPVDATWNGEEWEYEMDMRKQELKDLQAQNGAGNERLVGADFPTTASDLTFSQRMANASTGYAPYKDESAYTYMGDIEDEEDYYTRRKNNTNTTSGSTTTTTTTSQAQSGASSTSTTATAPIISETGASTEYASVESSQNTSIGAAVPFAAGFVAGGVGLGALAGAGAAAAAGATAGGAATIWSGPFAVGGAIIGAVAATAAFLLSESDVLYDPVRKEWTGCNILLEKADRKVNVGGFMFCAQYKTDADGNSQITGWVPGYARQCMHNKRKPTTQSQPGLNWIINDFWSRDCVQRLCDDTPTAPEDPNAADWTPDLENVCWRWKAK